MIELPAYERDAYLRELTTDVVEAWEGNGGCYAVLADTLFYPEGGGQPADHGELNGIPVRDVQKREGRIIHALERPVLGGRAHLTLDWARRFDHMQQHTGQHLLTAVAQDRFRWETTAFHLGPETCDIELDAPRISARQLVELEEAVAVEIRAARPVSARRVGPEAYGAEQVRSRGLPEGHRGDIRLVEIAGVDLNTCGGTHVRGTAELELIKLLATEPIRGGTRLAFVAGRRARLRMDAHEARNALLRSRLGAPDQELPAALDTKLEQLQVLERRLRRLEEEAAEAMAQSLSAEPGALAERHLEGKDAAFLQRCARRVAALAPSLTVFLTGGSGDMAAFVLACGGASGRDAGALGKVLTDDLSGRGGGSGAFYQGICPNLLNRPAALDNLKRAIGP